MKKQRIRNGQIAIHDQRNSERQNNEDKTAKYQEYE